MFHLDRKGSLFLVLHASPRFKMELMGRNLSFSDPECLCSFSCDFTTLREQTGTPQAQTCKPTPGPLNDTIQLTNAAVVNGMAQLRLVH